MIKLSTLLLTASLLATVPGMAAATADNGASGNNTIPQAAPPPADGAAPQQQQTKTPDVIILDGYRSPQQRQEIIRQHTDDPNPDTVYYPQERNAVRNNTSTSPTVGEPGGSTGK